MEGGAADRNRRERGRGEPTPQGTTGGRSGDTMGWGGRPSSAAAFFRTHKQTHTNTHTLTLTRPPLTPHPPPPHAHAHAHAPRPHPGPRPRTPATEARPGSNISMNSEITKAASVQLADCNRTATLTYKLCLPVCVRACVFVLHNRGWFSLQQITTP